MDGRSKFVVSKAVLAELFQVSAQAVDNWVRHGCPRINAGARGKEAKFDLAHVLPWYKASKDGSTNRRDLDAARTELTRKHERKTEIEIRRLEAALVPVEDFGTFASGLIVGVRSRVMDLPRKMALAIAPPDKVKDAEAKLEAEVTSILENLASDATADEILGVERGRTSRSKTTMADVATAAEAHG